MANGSGKIKKGNVKGIINPRTVINPVAKKALRRAGLLAQNAKTEQLSNSVSVKKNTAAASKKRQGNKVIKSQTKVLSQNRSTDNQKSETLLKKAPLLKKVNGKGKKTAATTKNSRQLLKKNGKLLTKQNEQKTEKTKTNEPITKKTEEPLEYAVPLNEFWNSLSLGPKSYDSLFSHNVDTPHIWADPTVWNIVFAAVPTGYSIPDQSFINVLSQRIAWKLLENTLPEENPSTFDTMMEAITYPSVPDYSEVTSELTNIEESSMPLTVIQEIPIQEATLAEPDFTEIRFTEPADTEPSISTETDFKNESVTTHAQTESVSVDELSSNEQQVTETTAGTEIMTDFSEQPNVPDERV